MAQVYEDGCITKGTSNRIAGSVDRGSTATIDVGVPPISGMGVVGVLIMGFLIFFGLFKIPEIIGDQFICLDTPYRIANALSAVVMLTLMCIASLIANICCKNFFIGLLCSYGASIAAGAVWIILDNIILEHNYSFFLMLIAVPLGAIMFAVWPSIIVTVIYTLVRIVLKARKKNKVKKKI